jgi:hypothetical protein
VATFKWSNVAANLDLMTIGWALAGGSAVVMGGWIAAAVTTHSDLLAWPFWLFVGLFVVGLTLWVFGAGTAGLHAGSSRLEGDPAAAGWSVAAGDMAAAGWSAEGGGGGGWSGEGGLPAIPHRRRKGFAVYQALGVVTLGVGSYGLFVLLLDYVHH